MGRRPRTKIVERDPFEQWRVCPYCGYHMEAKIFPKEKVWGGLCGGCFKVVSCQPLDTGIVYNHRNKNYKK